MRSEETINALAKEEGGWLVLEKDACKRRRGLKKLTLRKEEMERQWRSLVHSICGREITRKWQELLRYSREEPVRTRTAFLHEFIRLRRSHASIPDALRSHGTNFYRSSNRRHFHGEIRTVVHTFRSFLFSSQILLRIVQTLIWIHASCNSTNRVYILNCP